MANNKESKPIAKPAKKRGMTPDEFAAEKTRRANENLIRIGVPKPTYPRPTGKE